MVDAVEYAFAVTVAALSRPSVLLPALDGRGTGVIQIGVGFGSGTAGG